MKGLGDKEKKRGFEQKESMDKSHPQGKKGKQIQNRPIVKLKHQKGQGRGR